MHFHLERAGSPPGAYFSTLRSAELTARVLNEAVSDPYTISSCNGLLCQAEQVAADRQFDHNTAAEMDVPIEDYDAYMEGAIFPDA